MGFVLQGRVHRDSSGSQPTDLCVHGARQLAGSAGCQGHACAGACLQKWHVPLPCMQSLPRDTGPCALPHPPWCLPSSPNCLMLPQYQALSSGQNTLILRPTTSAPSCWAVLEVPACLASSGFLLLSGASLGFFCSPAGSRVWTIQGSTDSYEQDTPNDNDS